VRFTPKVQDDLGTVDLFGTQVVKAHPELKSWGVGSPAKVPLEEMITERGKYVGAKRVKLAASYPIVQGYKGSVSPGYLIHFEDPLQFNQVNVALSVSPFGNVDKGERLHAKFQYKTLNWNLRYFHNGADFYDIFGPVERSRKGDALIAEFNHTQIYDPPRQLDLFATGAVFLGLEKLPTAQNITSPKNILSFETGARYTNTRKALGGVDHEKGIAWRAISSVDFAEGNFYPKIHGGIDYGLPLPLPNSSVWVYAHAGTAWGDKLNPLASFYFGSFRNNYVDERPEKRYREEESFPGFEIDEITARRFARLTGEINLPPIRFEELGTPAFYLSHLRPAVFAGGMATQDPEGDGHHYFDAGAQLDLNFNVAMRLPMVFSVGVAGGWADGEYRKTEWLASLKIM